MSICINVTLFCSNSVKKLRKSIDIFIIRNGTRILRVSN